jgi:hypothetical protein
MVISANAPTLPRVVIDRIQDRWCTFLERIWHGA